jgi:hypothetical protein
MSQRLQIVLPDPLALQLREFAAGADTPPSTLAAQIVGNGVALAAKDGKVRPLRSAPVFVGGRGRERAPWLEPYGGDPGWRKQMWGAVVALHGRYPTNSKRSRTRGGEATRKQRRYARSPYGEQNSTTPAKTPATSSPSRTSSPTTPKPSASRAAASPRHGSPARHRQSGLRISSQPARCVSSPGERVVY